MRQKDQSIRKYEQEIDSLQFRNDQVMFRSFTWPSLMKSKSKILFFFYYSLNSKNIYPLWHMQLVSLFLAACIKSFEVIFRFYSQL